MLIAITIVSIILLITCWVIFMMFLNERSKNEELEFGLEDQAKALARARAIRIFDRQQIRHYKKRLGSKQQELDNANAIVEMLLDDGLNLEQARELFIFKL